MMLRPGLAAQAESLDARLLHLAALLQDLFAPVPPS